MELNFEVPPKYLNLSTRLINYVRRHFWLYIPDTVIIIFLIIPPYTTNETIALISGLVVLGFRDIFLMQRLNTYLVSFSLEEAMVSYTIYKNNQPVIRSSSHISNIELRFAEKPFGSFLEIFENDQLVHQQYALGYWSKKRLKDLYSKFYSFKGDVDMSSMFKEHI